MSIAEIVLRIGASLGGWLIFVAHALMLSVLHRADCDPFSDTLWRGTLFFALLSALGLSLVPQGLPWRDSLRWLALAAGALAVYASVQLLPAIPASAAGGAPLCQLFATDASPVAGAPLRASAVERVWSPIQLAVLAAGVWQAARYWRAPAQPVSDDDPCPRVAEIRVCATAAHPEVS